MTVERVVSSHNLLTSTRRECTALETLNERLIIALNGAGTANYDPRPAIVIFLKSKDRRSITCDLASYGSQPFIKSFFRD